MIVDSPMKREAEMEPRGVEQVAHRANLIALRDQLAALINKKVGVPQRQRRAFNTILKASLALIQSSNIENCCKLLYTKRIKTIYPHLYCKIIILCLS